MRRFSNVSCGAPRDPEPVIYTLRIIQTTRHLQGRNPLIYSTRHVLGTERPARRDKRCPFPLLATLEYASAPSISGTL